MTVSSITDNFSNISTVQGTAGISIGTALITATDAVTLANANSLNGFTNAQVTLNSVQDTVSNITSIDGLTTSDVSMAAAAVTVTDAASLANATAINGFTEGLVTLNSVEDTYAKIQDIKSIPDGQVDMGAAAVKVTNNVTKTEVDDLRTDTTGNITLTSLTEDKGDLATINGFTDVILSTANITVTDNVDKSEADTIDAYSNTSGTVTLTSITDTVANVTAVENNANISLDTSTITVTDAASLANATAINGFTEGLVTLNSVEAVSYTHLTLPTMRLV